MESTIDTNMPSADGLQLPSKPVEDRLIGGRYQLCGLLKQEPTVETFLATDLVAGESVVVRLFRLADIPPSVRLRLEHDSAILRTLDSPWLAHVLDHGQEAEWFFVVRLHARDHATAASAARTVGTAGGLAAGALPVLGASRRAPPRGAAPRHSADQFDRREGLVAGRSHPDRFQLGGQPRSGHVDQRRVHRGRLVPFAGGAGTLDYDIGETADLYSAGIVLFECVTGHQPFRGDSVGAVLLQHMTSPVPELRSICPLLPRALDEVIQRLFRKDPRDRYQTTEAVLLDLELIGESLAAGARIDLRGRLARSPSLADRACLRGAQRELAQIDEQIGKVVAGTAVLACVEAESGGGKTRLLAEVALRGLRAGMWVLRGQGSEQVGQKPFRVFEGIVEDVITAAAADFALADAIRLHLGAQLDAVGTRCPNWPTRSAGKLPARWVPWLSARRGASFRFRRFSTRWAPAPRPDYSR